MKFKSNFIEYIKAKIYNIYHAFSYIMKLILWLNKRNEIHTNKNI